MGSLTNYLENKLLDHVLNNVAYTPAATLYLALATVSGVSRAGVLGLGVVAEADIKAARDWQAYEELRRRIQAGAAIAAGWLIQQRNAGAAVPEWATVLEHV